jgi:hypothetical protein
MPRSIKILFYISTFFFSLTVFIVIIFLLRYVQFFRNILDFVFSTELDMLFSFGAFIAGMLGFASLIVYLINVKKIENKEKTMKYILIQLLYGISWLAYIFLFIKMI